MRLIDFQACLPTARSCRGSSGGRAVSGCARLAQPLDSGTKLHDLPLPDGGRATRNPSGSTTPWLSTSDLGSEDGKPRATDLEAQLLVPIDLSAVGVGEEFTVHVGRLHVTCSMAGRKENSATSGRSSATRRESMGIRSCSPRDWTRRIVRSLFRHRDDPRLPAECLGLAFRRGARVLLADLRGSRGGRGRGSRPPGSANRRQHRPGGRDGDDQRRHGDCAPATTRASRARSPSRTATPVRRSSRCRSCTAPPLKETRHSP